MFLKLPLFVTADVVGLYPNNPDQAGVKAHNEALEKRGLKE